jgi:hypothetical protein
MKMRVYYVAEFHFNFSEEYFTYIAGPATREDAEYLLKNMT